MADNSNGISPFDPRSREIIENHKPVHIVRTAELQVGPTLIRTNSRIDLRLIKIKVRIVYRSKQGEIAIFVYTRYLNATLTWISVD